MPAQISNKGLATVKELYNEKGKRAKELKEQGKKIIGYFCAYPPVELITAAGLVPYRIMGRLKEPITEADKYLETIACPFIRSCLDTALKGDYDFLEGVVVPHSCDNVIRLYDIWTYNMKPSFKHCINIPHMMHPSSYEFLKMEMLTFKKSLENLIGGVISNQQLRDAIQLHNEVRGLVRQLYDLRKQDPPLISGSEFTQLLVAGVTIPAQEHKELLKSVIDEVATRNEHPKKKDIRVLVCGPVIDDTAFIDLIEESGAYVVMDDLCFGSRMYWHDVEMTDDPFDGLVVRYLEKLVCPRTYKGRPAERTYEEDLEFRFGYLGDFVREFNVNGVIIYIIRFCDIHELDLPDVRDYLKGKGLSVLHLEDDYTLASIAGLRTRVQAFLEMIH
ncbi:MAG: 2-hydroxyacyl-CoA dehydratase family protein [Thermodesulfobacteriota bacterium]|nr:2-hydroxyacyl-CoA dehydratase family protein [Thermodesulfobacteriota bacterium]